MEYCYDIALSFATENKDLAEKVYHYVRGQDIRVFFAPSPEAQTVLSGRNQREVFYRIFGVEAEYVALFVSKEYVTKEVPMEEANIAFSTHKSDGKVIPVYLDGTPLPEEMFDPRSTNYFSSSNPAEIASHLANRIKMDRQVTREGGNPAALGNGMNIHDNTAGTQVFAQTINIGKKDNT
ncbi:TIR domain-containing protein [uncultured Neglectibacter sp.]|uniref:TIR domain-containing protein n=1 Tax=uncultured Neglectibacter sp. TaxID=1924108 RepID=UPI0034DFA785